jgi:D-hexose-6-phosphate mutarotase
MMNFEVVETKQENAKIKVVGVGGGGGNAILHMINHDIKGVDFICANTDTQALKSVKSATTIKLGNAYQTDIDIEGRMLVRIPSDLQSYAEINEQKQVALVGMGNKFEIWNIENWEMRQTGGSLSTEILDVVLPESIKEMSF